MKFLIKTDANQTLAVIEVPEDDIATLAVERYDDPGMQLVGVDLYSDGSVVVGHWPDGDDWEAVLRTIGTRYPG
ncbi:hypothetical protein BJP40_06620 [Streptomyces sp. CC53]|uniref:hypothetical protein n=1 Tax=Streptomyces sp. CC53 TaxID=1906740 RepID=UPI0008DCFF7A|nr:hypothetical protein [Streptomyces sp. CC53]OII61196.1 hypothetical protein BJP40_06620 [Streptomyces sp. CC53]